MTYQIDSYLDPVEPVEQVPEYVYEDVDLGGVSWNYRLFWNDRAEYWQLDLWTSDVDEDGDPVSAIYGVRVVQMYPLCWANTGRRPLGGYLILVDEGDATGREPCTYDGLGWRWKLCWAVDDGLDEATVRPWTITVP